MNCPQCNHEKALVIDSRSAYEGRVTRRRMECRKCKHRFSSLEFRSRDLTRNYSDDEVSRKWDNMIPAFLSMFSTQALFCELQNRYYKEGK